jgi:hypothetical protein
MTRAVVIFLLGLPMLTLNAQAGQFKHVVYYPAGQLPYEVIATQLTANSNIDLVLADYLGNQIVTLIGNGDGTFQNALKFSAPAPFALAAGDFDGDGNQDLVVVEYGGTGKSSVAIFLGDGVGGFHESSHYASGTETTSVAVADFDGDGHLDIAVANNAGSVKLFFGTGKGTVKKQVVYKLPRTTPYSIAAGDLDGNHHPDLAVTDVRRGNVIVMLNDGTGKFQQSVAYSAGGGEAADVKIADLRNNGKQDLVIANLDHGMVVLLSNGEGTFGKPTIYQPTFQNWQPPEACTVADFNLDGKLDVACAPQLNDAYVFYGKGNGKFSTGVEIKESINHQGGFSIATGDFNNDNAPDLAIPIELKNKVAVMLNTK